MSWSTCATCGLKYSAQHASCPRCTTGERRAAAATHRGGSGWMLLAGGIAVLLVAWRTVLALGDADRTGSWRTFWSVFFGGG